MHSFSRTFLFLAVALLPVSGCLYRTHKVKAPSISTAQLQQATGQELIERINAQAARIQSLSETVDIAASSGGAKKGKVTEFQEIRGYILLRKPTMLRMIGLYPVVRNKAFDMVSDGDRFRLYIPAKNRFYVGSKDVTIPSKNTLENLRPQHILDALLIKAIDPETEIAFLEGGFETVLDPKSKKDVEQANYIVNVARKQPDGTWTLARRIFFSRLDLMPSKQLLYDKSGNIATIATYNNYRDHDGTAFPEIIQIERPQEEYSIQLGLVKLTLNQPLTDAQFALEQPPGSTQVDLDKRPGGAAVPAQEKIKR